MKSFLFMLVSILIMCAYIGISSSWPLPSFEQPTDVSPTVSPMKTGSFKSDTDDKLDVIYKTSTETKYVPTESTVLDIEKLVVPANKDAYLVGNPINVTVYIKSKSLFNLDNLIIKEESNPDLYVVPNTSGYVKIDPVEESIHGINLSQWNSADVSGSNIIYIRNEHLRPKEWLVYNFTILPQKEGDFHSDTLVRIGWNTSRYNDLYNRIMFSIKPSFKVTVSAQSEARKDDDIILYYYVEYTGENRNKFNIELANRSGEFKCCQNCTLSNLTLNKGNIVQFSPVINYSEFGTHKLPSVMINGCCFSGDGVQEIAIVDTLKEDMEKNNLMIQLGSLFSQILGVIVTLALGIFYKEFTKFEKEARNIANELHNIRLQVEKFSQRPEEYTPPWWAKPPSKP